MYRNKAPAKPVRKRNINHIAYLFIAPFLIVFLIFNVYPVFRTLYLSFTAYPGYGEPQWIGLDNYSRVLGDKFFWESLWTTVKIWSVNIVVQLGLAFLLTVVFSDIKYKIRGLSIFRAFFYLPNLIAPASIAFLFKTLLDWRFGTLNQILSKFGVDTPVPWLISPNMAPFSVAMINAWMWFGSSFIILMAGVQGIPRDYFEAAAIDGADRWKVFRKVTIPLLRPILIYVSITSLIGGLQMFDIPFLIAQGTDMTAILRGPLQTVVMYMYDFGFRTFQVGYAGAIAYVLFLIILAVAVMQFKVLNRED